MSNASPTMKEIADRVGVTPQTVANVLQGRTRGKWNSTALRAERIRRMAQDLGYRPNSAARATATGRFNCVCLLASTHGRHSILTPGMIRGSHDALAAHDIHLTIAHVDDDKLSDESFVPKVLREWTADGLLINYTHDIPTALLALVKRHNIPSIWLNSRQPADCVYFDDFKAGRDLARKLLALGHRRIAFVYYGQEMHYSVQERQGGYAAAMKAAGLTPRVIHETYETPQPDALGEHLVPVSAGWLSRADRPTAIITYSHVEALPTWIAAQQRGMRLPRDLSMATFADSVNDGMGLQITRMWTGHGDLARAAVSLLLEKIDSPAKELGPVAVPLHYWSGGSMVPPPPEVSPETPPVTALDAGATNT